MSNLQGAEKRYQTLRFNEAHMAFKEVPRSHWSIVQVHALAA